MKADKQDLKDLADDLHGALQRHPDATRANPDIASDIVKVRDKAQKRYDDLSEKKPHDS